MGGTHFLQTGYLLLNRNAPLVLKVEAKLFILARDIISNV